MKHDAANGTVRAVMPRRSHPLLILLAALSAGAFPAAAQAPIRTPAYDLVVVHEPAKPDPAALETFSAIRQAITAKDDAKLTALIAPDFAALSCSTDPTAPCPPRKGLQTQGRSPIERLRLALCCGGRADPGVSAADRTEAMFGVLGSLLDGGVTAGAETVCQPALPQFDRQAVATLAKRLDLESSAMRITATPIEARAKPERDAPVLATIPKGAILPLLTTSATPAPGGWTVLALPAGGIGYAEGIALDELAPEAACLRRTKAGWRLAVLIGRRS